MQPTEIHVPPGPLEPIRLVRWIAGDRSVVHLDQPICELETDKASVELPSPASGTLRQIAMADEEVQVGMVLGVIAAAP
ncbi:MAG: biotin/lipoyl-containing protein [Phycisphaerae bacterium]|nr:lipoyl domain-containing protein [Tepidisphaeraceae bacterium]